MSILTEPRQIAAASGRLINLIIKRLVPMLLDATDGDPHAARALAIETVNDYAARNNADLLAIAQIIACGLASLGNLSLSMAGDVPHALLLRLQAAANALDRTAQQNRRVLQQAPPPQTDFRYDPGPGDASLEAAALAEARQEVAQAQAHYARADRAAAPEPVATPSAAPSVPAPAAETLATAKPPERGRGAAPDLTDHEKAMIWAGGMNQVAAEFKAAIPDLLPVQRRQASLRVQALSSTASALIAGVPPDGFRLPKRPGKP